ncbi:MAG TPA: FecR domain-containing protein [Bacteroidales bacterium]|nr:FecR domain-containing protein [Bacteroidales bacterium]HPI68318.1 FecR domain-containing protein [Bacteroidales bacterium]
MANEDKYNSSEWEKLARHMSEENNQPSDFFQRFLSEDKYNTYKQWKELKNMDENKEIDVDYAWRKVVSRLNKESNQSVRNQRKVFFSGRIMMKIAAVSLILVSLGIVTLYMAKTGFPYKKTVISTGINETNREVILPDGSNVFLNRNTYLAYRSDYGKAERNVELKGEAFFEVSSDTGNPFTVDAGKARIKVLGTSFNVITDNPEAEVEVFVETGHVILSDNSGKQNILLDSGYVGTIGSEMPEKKFNNDPNYLAYHKGVLKYDGQTLDIVFRDLERVYDMKIVADDPEILDLPWATTIDNQPHDTIIRLICASFILGYSKEGDVYHLTQK